MFEQKKGALIIFVKQAVAGEVKTRIAKSVGNEKALEIYQKLMKHTRDVSSQVDCERYLFYNKEVNFQDEWNNNDFSKFIQSGRDLGAKMQDAFETILPKTSPAIIIGSDCAEITASDIQRAFEELEDNDVVIGPAEDGGYYLLGMNDPQIYLFQDMPWSQEELLQETIFKIQDRGLRYSLLHTKSDIDYIEDWEKHKYLLED